MGLNREDIQMEYSILNKSQQGTVLILEFNSSERRNALSKNLLSQLAGAIREASDEILSIVITGGANCFSAGADFRELTGTSQDVHFDDVVSIVTSEILNSKKIIAAAIEGACVGAAADIALSCDYRIAGENAYIQIPACKLGILYNPAAIKRLQDRYRLDAVRRLLVLGVRMNANEAMEAGLFTRIVKDSTASIFAIEELMSLELAHSSAVRSTKQYLAELEQGRFEKEHWEERRIELLNSNQRKNAIEIAHKRFKDK